MSARASSKIVSIRTVAPRLRAPPFASTFPPSSDMRKKSSGCSGLSASSCPPPLFPSCDRAHSCSRPSPPHTHTPIALSPRTPFPLRPHTSPALKAGDGFVPISIKLPSARRRSRYALPHSGSFAPSFPTLNHPTWNPR
ncbi:hypothetical protein B0H13DRAFT_2303442 [Mycena leptocephala]|nr:hypothetical protein B0H13DRAFT_2303442 [Mycena leptocephala]